MQNNNQCKWTQTNRYCMRQDQSHKIYWRINKTIQVIKWLWYDPKLKVRQQHILLANVANIGLLHSRLDVHHGMAKKHNVSALFFFLWCFAGSKVVCWWQQWCQDGWLNNDLSPLHCSTRTFFAFLSFLSSIDSTGTT